MAASAQLEVGGRCQGGRTAREDGGQHSDQGSQSAVLRARGAQDACVTRSRLPGVEGASRPGADL